MDIICIWEMVSDREKDQVFLLLGVVQQSVPGDYSNLLQNRESKWRPASKLW